MWKIVFILNLDSFCSNSIIIYIRWRSLATCDLTHDCITFDEETENRLPKSSLVSGQQRCQCWSLQWPYTHRLDCSLTLTSWNSSLTSIVQNSLEMWSSHRQLSMANSMLMTSLARLAEDLLYIWKLWLCNNDEFIWWSFGRLLSKPPILLRILPAIISGHTVCMFNRASTD